MTPLEIYIIKTCMWMYVFMYVLVLIAAQVKGAAKWFIFCVFALRTDELCVGLIGLTGQYYCVL